MVKAPSLSGEEFVATYAVPEPYRLTSEQIALEELAQLKEMGGWPVSGGTLHLHFRCAVDRCHWPEGHEPPAELEDRLRERYGQRRWDFMARPVAGATAERGQADYFHVCCEHLDPRGWSCSGGVGGPDRSCEEAPLGEMTIGPARVLAVLREIETGYEVLTMKAALRCAGPCYPELKRFFEARLADSAVRSDDLFKRALVKRRKLLLLELELERLGIEVK